MKIFISWSGDLSHKIAIEFREWLPYVIQTVQPYVSSEEIDKGARWSVDIAKELESSSFGIVCVTPENIDSPWINFESGALSKAFDKARVSPFLFGLKNSDLKKSPLLQFQSTLFDEKDIFKLVISINSLLESDKLSDEKLKRTYEVWWPNLKEKLDSLKTEIKLVSSEKTIPKPQTNKDNNEILEEVLTLVRNQYKLLRSPEELFPEGYVRTIFRRSDSKEFMPSPNHKVWADLDNHYRSLLSSVDNIDGVDGLDIEEIKERIERIGRPIRYLLRRTRNEDQQNSLF